MPAIVIKDYQWRQTANRIIIYVPLTGRPKNVDLFVMDNYVKISFPPFVLELFLWADILEEESECTLTDTEAVFCLQKANSVTEWPKLELEGISKSQKREFRNRILKKAQNVSENRAKCRSEKRQHLQKEAVKAQINLDTDTLNRIESLKNAHRKAAMQDFEEWRLKDAMPILEGVEGKLQENRKAYRPPLKWFKDDNGTVRSLKIDEGEILRNKEGATKEETTVGSTEESNVKQDLNEESEKKSKEESLVQENRKQGAIFEENSKNETFDGKSQREINAASIERTTSKSDEESSDCSEDSESDYEMPSPRTPLIKEMDEKSSRRFYARIKKRRPDRDLIGRVLQGRYSRLNEIFDEPAKAIPLPRRSGTISVTFSERAFPTPARESSHIQEQEWLAKQADARRKTGFVIEDLRPEEQDPQWLKDKGDDFFKAGNYLAAISAYTHGIKISDKLTALYVNRSAAHYALGNYYRCIDDCSKVLELMEPKCEGNRISRAKCHARRGAALCKLSAPQHGIPELEAALKLDPYNEGIKRDLLVARQYFDIKE